jgi:hypothetical protein
MLSAQHGVRRVLEVRARDVIEHSSRADPRPLVHMLLLLLLLMVLLLLMLLLMIALLHTLRGG